MVVLKNLKDWNEKLVCADRIKEWEKSVLTINDKLNALTEFKPSELLVKHKEKNLKDSILQGIHVLKCRNGAKVGPELETFKIMDVSKV